jgi:CRP-like cAMP-binding protein
MRAGEMLFREGDPAGTVYLVESGRVRLRAVAGGTTLLIRLVGPGELLGAPEALSASARIVTAIADTDGTLVAIPTRNFLRLVDRHDAVRRLAVTMLADELSDTRERLVDRCAHSTLVRVAERLVAESSTDDGEPVVRTTQDTLAEWVGATRESTARALAELRRQGLVTTGRGWIRVDDLDGLEDLVPT